MKYIVQSTAVLDSITTPQSKEPINVPGGAGLYAMAGMKVWTDDVLIVTGTGADYRQYFEKWYKHNDIKMDGLLIKDVQTPKTLICYDHLGERTETPCFGARHYRKIEATPVEIAPFCEHCVGMYIFKNTDLYYWDGILKLKEKYGFQIAWEIAADAASFAQLSTVRDLAEQVEMLSINLAEARGLLGLDSVNDIIREFLNWNTALIYLRMGSIGVCVLKDGEAVLIPSVQSLNVVDPTGGGNSSTGGAFVGVCRGYAPEIIGAMGNVSASFCIEQWGVPECMDKKLRKRACRRVLEVAASSRKLT